MKRLTEVGLSDRIKDCGAPWDEMKPLDPQGIVRHCHRCDHSVEQVFTSAELEAVLAAGGCVAIRDEWDRKCGNSPTWPDDREPMRKGREPWDVGREPWDVEDSK